MKKENLKRLKKIDEELKEKWDKIIEALSKGETIKIEEKEGKEETEEKKEIKEEKTEMISEEKSKRDEMVEILKKIKEKIK